MYVSAASVREVAIKQALGKIAGPADLPEQVQAQCEELMLVTADRRCQQYDVPLLPV